jgi:hypothetical protein
MEIDRSEGPGWQKGLAVQEGDECPAVLYVKAILSVTKYRGEDPCITENNGEPIMHGVGDH